MSVPLHPEAVPGRPQTVRWVVPAGVTPFVGEVAGGPGDLGRLLDDGDLVEVVTEPAAVVTTLTDGLRWRAEGGRVREALASALGAPGWVPAGQALGDDEALLTIGREVAAGRGGELVRGHGGLIEVVGAHDGVLDVRLSGACHGCAALPRTLSGRLEVELRRRYPALVGVRDVS